MSNDDPMTRLAGAYANTASGLLGEKRSTMLQSELQLQAETGRVRNRGYTCYPGKQYDYGLPYIRTGETVGLAMSGWPDPTVCGKKKKKTERDFKALNRGAVDMGLTSHSDWKAYRAMYDVRKQPEDDESLRRAPLVFPPGMTFGLPPRPSTPIGEILEHRYQKCWIQNRLADYVKKLKDFKTDKKIIPGAYIDTNTTRLRKYQEPVDPRPLWHMPRFSKYAEPHLDTFRSDKERMAAFKSAHLDTVPRRGQFADYRSGIREPAQS